MYVCVIYGADREFIVVTWSRSKKILAGHPNDSCMHACEKRENLIFASFLRSLTTPLHQASQQPAAVGHVLTMFLSHIKAFHWAITFCPFYSLISTNLGQSWAVSGPQDSIWNVCDQARFCNVSCFSDVAQCVMFWVNFHIADLWSAQWGGVASVHMDCIRIVWHGVAVVATTTIVFRLRIPMIKTELVCLWHWPKFHIPIGNMV